MGIIPARAGFTLGVAVPLLSPGGSSPLARGLHGENALIINPGRIIPARAGFTDNFGKPLSIDKDHPRSRGVYGHHAVSRAYAGGSSPLARGLPALGAPAVPRARIIPARAGFTSAFDPVDNPGEDHPRSRGVYAAQSRGPDHELGSSPLARGLQLNRGIGVARERIIPARAGFTPAENPPRIK